MTSNYQYQKHRELRTQPEHTNTHHTLMTAH